MHPRQIDRFFRTLAETLNAPATVILTGAAAGSLWGHVRASLDVDFAISPSRRSPQAWARIEQAIERAQHLTGIAANYAEDIDRWSAVSFLDYRRHTRPYRRFGTLEVRLLDPAYWSIGKIARYLPPDIQDLAAVLKRQRIPFSRLVRLWARAIRRSPHSPALTRCRDHAEDFFRTFGPRIWGSSFRAELAIRQFRRALAGGSSAS